VPAHPTPARVLPQWAADHDAGPADVDLRKAELVECPGT
jgi:hypothetical protein